MKNFDDDLLRGTVSSVKEKVLHGTLVALAIGQALEESAPLLKTEALVASFKKALGPAIEPIYDLLWQLTRDGARRRAVLVREIMKESGLSEMASVAVVLRTETEQTNWVKNVKQGFQGL